MEWHEAVVRLERYVVQIQTPDSYGTGWLVSLSALPLCGIATAAHVIGHANYWEEPIRILHPSSGHSILLHPGDRAILMKSELDTAGIVFAPGDIPFPASPPALIEKGMCLKTAVEIGWLGFPALPNAGLCFFSGRISAWRPDDQSYLVDGVAINGVSGGPAFSLGVNQPQLIGVVSAYMPNRATGEVLPGLAVVRDVAQFHDLADRFRSMDEAKASLDSAPPPPPSPSPSDGEIPSRG